MNDDKISFVSSMSDEYVKGNTFRNSIFGGCHSEDQSVNETICFWKVSLNARETTTSKLFPFDDSFICSFVKKMNSSCEFQIIDCTNSEVEVNCRVPGYFWCCSDRRC